MRLRAIIFWLSVAAIFSLTFHSDKHVKPFDILIVSAGILALCEKDFREDLKKMREKIIPYGILCAMLALFVILGRVTQEGTARQFDMEFFKNMARILLHGATFLFLALQTYREQKFLFSASIAIFVSSLAVIPAYWNYTEGAYIEGGRLAGYIQTPIIWGLYTMVIFLVGLGLLFTAKKILQKIAVALPLLIVASFILWAASRAAWLALAIALTFWFYYLLRQKNIFAAVGLFSVVLAVFLVGDALLPRSPTLAIKQWVEERAAVAIRTPLAYQGQIESWKIASRDIASKPLGTADFTAPNNTLLQVARYGGAGALAVFVLLCLKIGADIVRGFKKLNNSPHDALLLAWLLVIPALAIDIFFTDGFLLRHVWAMTGVSLGAGWHLSKS